jgi:signal transduction histidine kinase
MQTGKMKKGNNIYMRKSRWKIWLALSAVLIVAATLWYTGNLVKKIAGDERQNVEIWAEAVQKRAKLVKVTRDLFRMLEEEEGRKAEVLADATSRLITSDEDDLTFYTRILESNTTIPVIVTYEDGTVWTFRNLPEADNDSLEYAARELEKIRDRREPLKLQNSIYGIRYTYYLYYDDSKIYKQLRATMDDITNSFITETVINSASVPVVFTDSAQTKVIQFGKIDTTSSFFRKAGVTDVSLIQFVRGENEPIRIQLGGNEVNYIFYRNSNLVRQLRFFPYVQLTIIGLFLITAYFLFSTARRSEQNQVWAGMSKETAHQLGTPISSLVGWVEILKARGVDQSVTEEIEKDVRRLETIADRFSKVGSVPEPVRENLRLVLEEALHYMEVRTSKKIKYEFIWSLPGEREVFMSRQLFEWVIENLCRNSIDALPGHGFIRTEVQQHADKLWIDISDNGKGIPKNKWKTIFRPGYTTKQRGWGLGLSLARRIIVFYHKGKIFVKESQPDGGTTIRIVLPCP